jgi:hypothetical protein
MGSTLSFIDKNHNEVLYRDDGGALVTVGINYYTLQGGNIMYGMEQMEGVSAFSWPTGVIGYVCLAIGLYFSAKKADTKNPWVAFIPVVQIVVLLQLIGKSGWAIFLLLIPVVNWILMIIWMVKYFKAFDAGSGFVAATIITMIIVPLAFVTNILLLVVGVSKKYNFTGSTRFTA